MSDKDINRAVLLELRKISKILSLVNASILEKELAKIANSASRKKIWVLIDGKRMPRDLAEEASLTTMAVSYFLNKASSAGFIEYIQREPPRRILDYVPPSWINLVVKESGESEQEPSEEIEDVEDTAKEKACTEVDTAVE